MAGFGDIFASAFAGSNPYAQQGLMNAQETTRQGRMDVARAFTEWRKANPEATAADVQQFLRMATGGDMSLAQGMTSGSVLEDMDRKAAEAKAKRIRDEQEARVVDDMKWKGVIEQTFEKALEANAYNIDAAVRQTEAEIMGNPQITDPETKKVFGDRFKSFNFKGHAQGLNNRYITENYAPIQEVARDAFAQGLDEKGVMGRINAYTRRVLDPTDQSLQQIMGAGKRAWETERTRQENAEKEREYVEAERQRVQQERDESDAKAIAALRNNKVGEDAIAQMFPNATKLTPLIQAQQRALATVGESQAMGRISETATALRQSQATEMNVSETAKTFKDNPIAQTVYREIATNYALSSDQRAKLIEAVSDKKLAKMNYQEARQAVLGALGPAYGFDEVAKASVTNQFGKLKPLSFSEALNNENASYQSAFQGMQSAFKQAVASTKDEETVGVLGQLENKLVALLSGGIDKDYADVQPTLFGEVRDPAATAAAVAAQKRAAQSLLQQVRAAKQKKAAEASPAKKKGNLTNDATWALPM